MQIRSEVRDEKARLVLPENHRNNHLSQALYSIKKGELLRNDEYSLGSKTGFCGSSFVQP